MSDDKIKEYERQLRAQLAELRADYDRAAAPILEELIRVVNLRPFQVEISPGEYATMMPLPKA